MTTDIAIIGGSQAYSLLTAGVLSGERVEPLNTPFGESQPVLRLRFGEREVLFLSRHGQAGYSIAAPWVNYRANIWALKELGAARVISWSGPGAIDQSLKIGQFVTPDDLIDETKCRDYSFFTGAGWGFVRQNPVFCPCLRGSIALTMDDLGLTHRPGGTYVCTEGPRLETPAEIRKFRILGGDMVGMTLVPEVFLARELEMCYAPICYITNYAEGLRDRPFQPGILFEGLLDDEERRSVDTAVSSFPSVIESLVARITDQLPTCHCRQLMERYRRRGDIGPDWHTWMNAECGMRNAE